MEVLLVMAILVIIGSIVSVSYIGIQKRSKRNGAQMQAGELKTAVETYYLTFNSYPTDLNGLITGPSDPNQAKGFKKGEIWPKTEIPVDPWGNKYVMKVDQETESVIIYSLGPNRTDEGGAGDDISSDS